MTPGIAGRFSGPVLAAAVGQNGKWMQGMPGSISYGLITLVGITVTALLWRRLARADGRAPDDRLYAV